jgi:hypothetical protein
VRRAVEQGEVALPSRLPRTALARRDVTRAPRRTIVTPPASGSAYDACLAAGREHLLAAQNFAVAICAKASGALLPPTTLAGWFHDLPPEANFVFDPRALYDQYADRWVVLALAWHQPPSVVLPDDSWLLISVSEGPDPTRHWHSVSIETMTPAAPQDWADYPAVGVDERAVYVTYNVQAGQARLMVFPKRDLYDGRATFFDFPKLANPDGSEAIAVQPCHHFGPTETAHLVNTVIADPARPSDHVTLWTVDWSSGAPAVSSRGVPVEHPYITPPKVAEQLGEKSLDVGGTRVRSAVCRDTSVWFGFATGHGQTLADAGIAARWCRLDVRSSAPAHSDELAGDGASYVFPGLAVDAAGTLTMVASHSTASEHPSLHYGRWPAEGPAEAGRLVAGQGPHLKCRANEPCSNPNARNGWGDYNALALDPSDGTTVWAFGGVGHATDPTLWATSVVAV